MSKLATGIFGALAVSMAAGAVQFASGHDLGGMLQERLPAAAVSTDDILDQAIVNRATKADRATRASGSVVQTRTISLHLDGLADTSIVVRIPLAKQAGNDQAEKDARDNAPPSSAKSGERKATVACEPVVSVLTEVAKRLQPGRCIT